MRSVILLFAALALAAVPSGPGALAQGSPFPQQPAVSVTGTGEVERKPDFARVHIAVVNEAETVGEAVEVNSKATEQALARLAALGIAREDIRTTNFQVYETPQFHPRDGSELKRPKFTASHHLRVVTREVDEVGALAGEILALDAMTFQSIEWGLDRSDEAEDEARAKAVADARRQAEVYARAAGVTLGPLRAISDGVITGGPRPEMLDAPMMRMAAAAPSVPIVPPASVKFSSSVRVEWGIAGQQ